MVSDLFNQGRICKYCGVNMDTIDIPTLEFFHRDCWQSYRKNGELYPMPLNFGEYYETKEKEKEKEKEKRKKTVLEELIEIEERSPDLFEALAKEDKSLIKEDD